jgi:hypothetical protein
VPRIRVQPNSCVRTIDKMGASALPLTRKERASTDISESRQTLGAEPRMNGQRIDTIE